MTEPSNSIQDNIGTVQVILLMRIYDLLWVDLASRDPETAAKVAEVHEIGEFVGPNPSLAGQEADPDV